MCNVPRCVYLPIEWFKALVDVYPYDWSIVTHRKWKHWFCYPRSCCWCESHPLLNQRWSLRRQNVWDNHLIIWNYGGIYLFSRSSSWCYPKPRSEFWYWNIQWSLDLLGVGTGSMIRPELESMRNEVKHNYDLVVEFDTLILWYDWWFNNDAKRKGF